MILTAPFNGRPRIWQLFGQNVFYPNNPYWPYPGHNGVDFGVPLGGDLFAIHSGVVTWAGLDPATKRGNQDQQVGYGWYVEVTNGVALRTRYCHMIAGSIPPPITEGTHVQDGVKIGRCNATGYSRDNAGRQGGPHLHIEGHTTDPMIRHPHYVSSGGWGRFDLLPYLPVASGGAGRDLPLILEDDVAEELKDRIHTLEDDKDRLLGGIGWLGVMLRKYPQIKGEKAYRDDGSAVIVDGDHVSWEQVYDLILNKHRRVE